MFKRASKRFSKFKNKQRLKKSANIPADQQKQATWLDDFKDEAIHVIDKPKLHLASNQFTHFLAMPKLKRKPIQPRSPSQKGIGIFSATFLYSDFIRSSLQILEVDIEHFGHPNTLHATAYPIYDDIPAWIIFLSDSSGFHSQDHFLERFLERYVDKPTLFLCAQASRVKTSEKINQFIADTGLFKPSHELKHKNDIALL